MNYWTKTEDYDAICLRTSKETIVSGYRTGGSEEGKVIQKDDDSNVLFNGRSLPTDSVLGSMTLALFRIPAVILLLSTPPLVRARREEEKGKIAFKICPLSARFMVNCSFFQKHKMMVHILFSGEKRQSDISVKTLRDFLMLLLALGYLFWVV